jgi:peptide/nickel transport system ATP-binding protein
MSQKNVVEVQNLDVKFYTYAGVVEALDGVNLTLREGEILGLVGETGCGKSVTSLSILMLVPPPGRIEGGKIRFDKQGGADILRMNDASLRSMRGKDISMIFQEPRAYLNPVYTVEDQISEVMLVHRQVEFFSKAIQALQARKSKGLELNVYRRLAKNPESRIGGFIGRFSRKRQFKDEVRNEVVRVLKSVEIPDPERVAHMYPHELSGGMAQRVVIAMALACYPTMLIADEPTTNLDVTVQAQILNLVKQLRDNFKSSILYITHDLGVVAQVCDRVAVMYAGNVVETADVFELFGSPLHPYTRALLESIPRPGKAFKSIPGIVPSLINPLSGCRFRDRCPYAMEICLKVKPPFDEVKKGHFAACYLYGGS